MTTTSRVESESIASPPDTMAIALSLAKAGWPVFPVSLVPYTKTDEQGVVTKGLDKRPLVKWLDGATTEPEQIATWWGIDFPGAWIGVHAGRAGIVVVDLDLDKGAGAGKDNLKAAGIDLPKTLHYKTRSGGAHHVYAAPEGLTLTIARDHPVPGVDIRAGNGLMVYYGPVLTEAPELASAPDWALLEGVSKPRGVDGDIGIWMRRAAGGKPQGDLKRIARKTDWAKLTHEPMLEMISELVKRGAEPGAATVFAEGRARYVAGRPDRERDWDNAAAGSIGRYGLPPVTLAMTKTERKALKARNTPEAIEAVQQERKNEYRVAKVDERLNATEPDPGNRDLTDAALAEEIAAGLVGKWANASGIGLLRYDGIIWRPVDETLLFETVRKRVRIIRAEETKAAIMRGDKKREDEARGIESRTRVVAIARFAAGILLESAPTFDADPDLLNTPEGVVDLRTGVMRKRRPDDYLTKVTGARYVPGATTRDWRLALKALPKSTAKWLQIRFGQAATGRIPEDKAVPFLVGGGDNGKSVIVGGIRNALGTYAVTVPERLLLGNDSDHPTDIMTLEGTRVALFEELPRGGRLNAQRLKLLSGTNRMSGRRMRQDFHEFPATHMLAGATNHLPVITDVDDAIWERVAPVPFPYKFVNRKPRKGTNERRGDPGLRDRLAAEPDEAVLAWLVAGAVASYQGVPDKPPAVLAALEDWRGEADPVLGFTRDHLELSEDHAVVATELYAEFGRYLESRGQQRWSDQLIATSFTGHSSLPGVTKQRVMFGDRVRVSRSLFAVGVPSTKAMAWVGVRFKEEGGGLPPSPEVADFERWQSFQ